MFSTTWTVLGISSIIAMLFTFSKGKNSIWGGLTMGVVVGLIIALVYLFKGDGFKWVTVAKAGIIGTLSGVVADLLGTLSSKKRRLS